MKKGRKNKPSSELKRNRFIFSLNKNEKAKFLLLYDDFKMKHRDSIYNKKSDLFIDMINERFLSNPPTNNKNLIIHSTLSAINEVLCRVDKFSLIDVLHKTEKLIEEKKIKIKKSLQ